MSGVLLLTHRVPYPPDKGDKIRSYQLLRALQNHYRVFLGTFVDDPRDWQYVDDVRRMCEDCHFATLNRRWATVRSLSGLLTGEALTLGFYRDRRLGNWVSEVLTDGSIERIVVFSSSMAQYVMDSRASARRRIIDFCDVDSDKWKQYAKSLRWPRSVVYNREARRLLETERSIAECFDASVFVSHLEVDLFRQLAPESANKVHLLANGVDHNYFDPELEHTSPYPDTSPVIVFTGAMDYWANVDAVSWFVREVWPTVREAEPTAVFYIVGSSPSDEVLRLEETPGVVVTGRVPDVRPYLSWSQVSVAPLRIARGVQNKVLEALAMSVPVVATSQALQGIGSDSIPGVAVADDNSGFANAVIVTLRNKPATDQELAERDFVRSAFDWTTNFEKLVELVAAGA